MLMAMTIKNQDCLEYQVTIFILHSRYVGVRIERLLK